MHTYAAKAIILTCQCCCSSGSTSFPKLIHLSNRYVITLTQHDSYERALADNPDLLQYTVEPSDVFLVGFPMYAS